MTELPGFYPVNIRESRYSGTYSQGQWVLMAGCYCPEQTDAFGSDIDCLDFWTRVEKNGPVVQIEGVQSDVYVASGDDPTGLLEEAAEHLDEHCTHNFECVGCGTEFESENPYTDTPCPECDTRFSSFRRSTEYHG